MLYRSNAYLHHTGIFLQREPAARVFSVALPLSYSTFALAGIEPATVGFVEVTRAFTTLQILAAGISEQSFFQCASGASANFSAAGFEPVTDWSLVFEVALFFTTPQILESFFLASLLHYLSTSSFAHTPSVTLNGSLHFANSALFKIPGRNQRSRCFGFRTRRPVGLSIQEVTVNFTIPGACGFRKSQRKSIYAVPVAEKSRNWLQFPRKTNTLSRRILLDRNDLSANRRNLLRVA
jgi:hypothetical protein